MGTEIKEIWRKRKRNLDVFLFDCMELDGNFCWALVVGLLHLSQ